MRKIVLYLFILFFINYSSYHGEIKLIPESSDYNKTSTSQEVNSILFQCAGLSPYISLYELCRTTEGQPVYYVLVSSETHRGGNPMAYEKPFLLINANIHAGEVEGKEACLKFLKKTALHPEEMRAFFRKQNLVLVPNLNPEGNNEMSAKNRGDKGPEMAGRRHNSQGLDLNRDFLKLETPEVGALIKLMNTYDPLVFMDMHTKNGSWHREPVTLMGAANPNSSRKIKEYFWKDLYKKIQKTMKKKYDVDIVPYGNFKDRSNPEKGWENRAFPGRLSMNYAGLRNRVSILDENYPHVDFKTRIESAYSLLLSLFETTDANMEAIQRLCREADSLSVHAPASHLYTSSENSVLFHFTLKSYQFITEKIKEKDLSRYPSYYNGVLTKKTDKLVDYRLPYLASALPADSVRLPLGYFLEKGETKAVKLLLKHGIIVKRLTEELKIKVEEFVPRSIDADSLLNQGHVLIRVQGDYKKLEKKFNSGDYYIPFTQPLGKIAALLLEPESRESLLAWGFFNGKIVKQWGRNRPGRYPVYKCFQTDNFKTIILK